MELVLILVVYFWAWIDNRFDNFEERKNRAKREQAGKSRPDR